MLKNSVELLEIQKSIHILHTYLLDRWGYIALIFLNKMSNQLDLLLGIAIPEIKQKGLNLEVKEL